MTSSCLDAWLNDERVDQDRWQRQGGGGFKPTILPSSNDIYGSVAVTVHTPPPGAPPGCTAVATSASPVPSTDAATVQRTTLTAPAKFTAKVACVVTDCYNEPVQLWIIPDGPPQVPTPPSAGVPAAPPLSHAPLEVRCAKSGLLLKTISEVKTGCIPTAIAHVPFAFCPTDDQLRDPTAPLPTTMDPRQRGVGALRFAHPTAASPCRDFVWVGMSDGSIRVIAAGEDLQLAMEARTAGGDRYAVFETAKVHAGPITAFAVSPHRARVDMAGIAAVAPSDHPDAEKSFTLLDRARDDVDLYRETAPLASMAWPHRRRFNNTLCVASADSCVTVWSVTSAYRDVCTAVTQALTGGPDEQIANVARDLVTFSYVDGAASWVHGNTPATTKDDAAARAAVIAFQAKSNCLKIDSIRPLVRLKHSVCGVRSLSWVTPVFVDKAALPAHWAWDHALRQTQRHEAPATTFGVAPDPEDDKMDDAMYAQMSRRQHFIKDAPVAIKADDAAAAPNTTTTANGVASMDGQGVRHPSLHHYRAFSSTLVAQASVDVLLVGDDEGHFFIWNLEHEVSTPVGSVLAAAGAETASLDPSQPYDSPAPPAAVGLRRSASLIGEAAALGWANASALPRPSRRLAGARTSAMQIKFPFPAPIMSLAAVLPSTLPIQMPPRPDKAASHNRSTVQGTIREPSGDRPTDATTEDAVSPDTPGVSQHRPAAQEVAIAGFRALYSALDICVTLEDSTVQLVSCHVTDPMMSTAAGDGDSPDGNSPDATTSQNDPPQNNGRNGNKGELKALWRIPQPRLAAGQGGLFRVGAENLVSGSFDIDTHQFTVFFTHREVLMPWHSLPSRPRVSCAVPLRSPFASHTWVGAAAQGSDECFVNGFTLSLHRVAQVAPPFSSPTRTATNGVVALRASDNGSEEQMVARTSTLIASAFRPRDSQALHRPSAAADSRKAPTVRQQAAPPIPSKGGRLLLPTHVSCVVPTFQATHPRLLLVSKDAMSGASRITTVVSDSLCAALPQESTKVTADRADTPSLFGTEALTAQRYAATQSYRAVRDDERRATKREAKQWRVTFVNTTKRLAVFQLGASDKRDRANVSRKLSRYVKRRTWQRRVAWDDAIFPIRERRIAAESDLTTASNQVAQSQWMRVQSQTATALLNNITQHRQIATARFQLWRTAAAVKRHQRQLSMASHHLATWYGPRARTFHAWLQWAKKAASNRRQERIFLRSHAWRRAAASGARATEALLAELRVKSEADRRYRTIVRGAIDVSQQPTTAAAAPTAEPIHSHQPPRPQPQL